MMNDKFLLSGQYRELLSKHGIDVGAALRRAHQPEDLFAHPSPSMTTAGYHDFMEAIAGQIEDDELPIAIGSSDKIEMFSPPIFAAYSSPDGREFLHRLVKYKRLICPLLFEITETDAGLQLTISMPTDPRKMPPFLAETEFVFILSLLRRATKTDIRPVSLILEVPPPGQAFEKFAGIAVKKGTANSIIFRPVDLEIPFISRNDAMWEYFEPELKRRLSEMTLEDSFQVRVRSALIDLLPGGTASIDLVAQKLGLSRRSLQRFLSNEGKTFQKELDHTRFLLAKQYLRDPSLTLADMTYLLGYQDVSTFQRAFHKWTNMSLTQYKETHR